MINTEEKSRVPMIDVIKGIHWQGILLCLMSFVIGRVCIFDTFYTLGIAYVAAMFFNKSTRRWSMVLCLLGILSVGMIDFEVVKYMLMLVIIAVLREAMIFFKYEINLRNQLLVLGISILSINCMSLALQDFTIYRAITSLLETAVALGLMSILNLALTILY